MARGIVPVRWEGRVNPICSPLYPPCVQEWQPAVTDEQLQQPLLQACGGDSQLSNGDLQVKHAWYGRGPINELRPSGPHITPCQS